MTETLTRLWVAQGFVRFAKVSLWLASSQFHRDQDLDANCLSTDPEQLNRLKEFGLVSAPCLGSLLQGKTFSRRRRFRRARAFLADGFPFNNKIN